MVSLVAAATRALVSSCYAAAERAATAAALIFVSCACLWPLLLVDCMPRSSGVSCFFLGGAAVLRGARGLPFGGGDEGEAERGAGGEAGGDGVHGERPEARAGGSVLEKWRE